jgi:hypothetical protein
MSKRPPSFFATEETATVDLEDGYWVELKRGLDYGEESELEGAAIRLGTEIDSASGKVIPRVEFSIRDQRILMLALYIIDWNLVDPDGRAVEIPDGLAARRTLFASLHRDTAARIVAEIEALRAASGEPEAISLEGLEGVELDPTRPGDGTATSSGSPSPNGSAAATPTSSRRLRAPSGRRSP